MPRTAKHDFKAPLTDNGQTRYGPPDEDVEDDDALALPVEPDEGMPLIPDDDERVVNVPS